MKQHFTLLVTVVSLISASAQHISNCNNSSMAVCSDSVAVAWGNNSYGQLGDSSTTARNVPVAIYNLDNLVQMSGGFGHTVALRSDSTVWGWGRNDYGALGNNTTTGSITPVQAQGISGIKQITAGSFFTLALASNDSLWAWGHNNTGQLGLGNTTNQPVPIQVTSIADIVSICGGRDYSLILKKDSTVWGMGLNDNGQLGIGSTSPSSSNVPVQAVGLDSIIAVSAGRYATSYALKADGTVWAWGYNLRGELGNGLPGNSSTPVQVSGLTDIVAIANQSGYGHTLAVKSDGTVWAWGYNLQGQLGDSSTTDSNIPVMVRNLSNIVSVSCGDNHSLAIDASGQIWAWGNNNSGQLGDSTNTDRTVPVKVVDLCAQPLPSAINNPLSALGVSVYPNPGKGYFTVKAEQLSKGMLHAAVYNIMGEKVFSSNWESSQAELKVDVMGNAAGVYILRLTDGNYAVTYKIAIE